MRGTPFFQAIFMIAVFLLVGWPVYRLTRPAPPTPTAREDSMDKTADGPAAKATPVEVEVVCASAPTDFQIKCLDQTVLAGRAPQAHFSKRWGAAIPPEGADLVIQAHWPVPGAGNASADAATGANPAAARVTARLSDGRQIEKSFWAGANGTMTEVFTIPGVSGEPAP